MIPATDEDRLKSKIYFNLGFDDSLDITQYLKLWRETFEREKYTEKKSKFNKVSLEDELLCLAYSFVNTPLNKRRKIDARALKTIKKNQNCGSRDPIVVHFFRIYNEMKRALPDFLSGNYFIENCLEDGEDHFIEKRIGDSLEDQLIGLAEEYERISEDKKRKVDYKALQIIRRCSVCKNSALIARSYYRIYYYMTGRGKQELEKPRETFI